MSTTEKNLVDRYGFGWGPVGRQLNLVRTTSRGKFHNASQYNSCLTGRTWRSTSVSPLDIDDRMLCQRCCSLTSRLSLAGRGYLSILGQLDALDTLIAQATTDPRHATLVQIRSVVGDRREVMHRVENYAALIDTQAATDGYTPFGDDLLWTVEDRYQTLARLADSLAADVPSDDQQQLIRAVAAEMAAADVRTSLRESGDMFAMSLAMLVNAWRERISVDGDLVTAAERFRASCDTNGDLDRVSWRDHVLARLNDSYRRFVQEADGDAQTVIVTGVVDRDLSGVALLSRLLQNSPRVLVDPDRRLLAVSVNPLAAKWLAQVAGHGIGRTVTVAGPTKDVHDVVPLAAALYDGHGSFTGVLATATAIGV